MNDFFRPEVGHPRQQDRVGRILVVRPLSITVMSAVVLAAALALGAWLSFGTYTRKAHLDGFVVADGEGRLRAELFAGSAAVRWLRADQRVRLRYPALAAAPGSGDAGAIVEVARSPVAAAELGALPTVIAARAAREPVYRVVARLDGPPDAVAAGMAIDADVPVARRRLIEWMVSARDRAAGSV